jgi:hypothetical protein
MKNDELLLREINELRKEIHELRQQRLERATKPEYSPVTSEEPRSDEYEKSESKHEWAELENVVSDLLSATQEEICDHPVGAIAIAFLFGFTLGRGT